MRQPPCAFLSKQWPRHRLAHATAPSSRSWTRLPIRLKILAHQIFWHHTKHANSSKTKTMRPTTNQLQTRWTTCSQQCRVARETAATARPQSRGSSPPNSQVSWTRNLISSIKRECQTNILSEKLVTPRAKISSQVIRNQTEVWSTRFCRSHLLVCRKSKCNLEMRKNKPTWTR